MARSLRIPFEGAFYHVTVGGNERRKIFLSHQDYEKFLSYLREAIQKYGVILHTCVLIPRHSHLMVDTPRANLSSFMHSLNSVYTTYFNLVGNQFMVSRERVRRIFSYKGYAVYLARQHTPFSNKEIGQVVWWN